MLRLPAATLALLLALTLPVAAQPMGAMQEATLTATSPEQNSFFGTSVSLSGDRAIVGVFNPDGRTDTVPVFVRSGDDWVLEADLAPGDGAPGDRFGESVAISGDRALVSAAGANDGATLASGAVYVFVRSDGVWTQEAKLTAPTPATFDFFGDTVALSGDRALVGANGAEGGMATQGRVFVFVRSDGAWTLQAELSPADVPNSYGDALALAGDRALVGASGDDEDPANDPFASGLGYVFVESDGVWTQETKLAVPDRRTGDQVAFSLALTDNRAVLGAPGEGEGGAAYVFLRSGTSWAQEARLTSADAQDGDRFGVAVALSNSRAFVGASSTDQGAGTVYAFDRSAGDWTQGDGLAANDGAADDRFGSTLALADDRLLIGATGVDANEGAAYVFSDVLPVDAPDGPEAATATLSAPSPNPSTGRAVLTLTVETPRTVRATVVDALGRVVRVLADGDVSGATTLQIETATLAPGVYTVRVEGLATALARRFTVVR